MGKHSEPAVVANTCNLTTQRLRQAGRAIPLRPAWTKEYSALKGQEGAL